MRVKLKSENFRFVRPSLPDSRDIVYKTSVTAVSEHSLEEFRGPILDQGSYGACTGFGTAGMLRSTFKRLTDLEVDFNPWFIYYNARSRSGWRYKDEGAYPREVFKSLVRDGVIEDSKWNPQNKIKEDPPKFSDADLIKFKSYKRFELKNMEQIQRDFSNFISVEKMPIGIAMIINEKSTAEAGKSGVFNVYKNDESLGAHWVYADKVNQNGITLVNSWSKRWGKNGTAIVPWDIFPHIIFEAWSLDPALP
jgi:uncharacterized protein with LGFP repeats